MGLIKESIILVIVVVLGLSMSHRSLGQSGGCTTALISLSPCLTYINAASGTTSNTPSSSCCSRLATMVQSQPRCLCSALNGGAAASLGVTINQTRALQLPAACRLQTPPPSRCNDNSNEGVAPTISPVSSPENSPDDEEDGEARPTWRTAWDQASFPSTTSSQNVPITGGIPSDGGQSLINSPFYIISLLSTYFCYIKLLNYY